MKRPTSWFHKKIKQTAKKTHRLQNFHTGTMPFWPKNIINLLIRFFPQMENHLSHHSLLKMKIFMRPLKIKREMFPFHTRALARLPLRCIWHMFSFVGIIRWGVRMKLNPIYTLLNSQLICYLSTGDLYKLCMLNRTDVGFPFTPSTVSNTWLTLNFPANLSNSIKFNWESLCKILYLRRHVTLTRILYDVRIIAINKNNSAIRFPWMKG